MEQIKVVDERRPALVRITEYTNRRYRVRRGDHNCHVLAIGQDHEEYEAGPGHYAVAVIELDDGRIISVPVENVRFLDTMMKNMEELIDDTENIY